MANEGDLCCILPTSGMGLCVLNMTHSFRLQLSADLYVDFNNFHGVVDVRETAQTNTKSGGYRIVVNTGNIYLHLILVNSIPQDCLFGFIGNSTCVHLKLSSAAITSAILYKVLQLGHTA